MKKNQEIVRSAFIKLMDNFRIQNGLVPLIENNSLAGIAQEWVNYQVKIDQYLAHDHFDKRTEQAKKIFKMGLTIGENVASNQGHSDPAYTAFDGLIHSKGHRKNIIKFNYCGTGVAKSKSGTWYFCQFFAMRIADKSIEDIRKNYLNLVNTYRKNHGVEAFFLGHNIYLITQKFTNLEAKKDTFNGEKLVNKYFESIKKIVKPNNSIKMNRFSCTGQDNPEESFFEKSKDKSELLSNDILGLGISRSKRGTFYFCQLLVKHK